LYGGIETVTISRLYELNIDRVIDGTIPLLAPAVTASRIYDKLSEIVDPAFAFAGALAIELIGFRAMRLQVRMKAHNDTNRNQNERSQFSAPMFPIWAIISIYLIVTGVIVFITEGENEIALVIAVFPLLGLVGAWFDGLQRGQNKRENARADEREKKKRERQAKNDERKQARQEAARQASKDQGKQDKQARTKASKTSKGGKASDEDLLSSWELDAAITNADLGRKFGISGEAIRQRKSRLLLSGDIKEIDGLIVVERS
jgi:hypothetical protein